MNRTDFIRQNNLMTIKFMNFNQYILSLFHNINQSSSYIPSSSNTSSISFSSSLQSNFIFDSWFENKSYNHSSSKVESYTNSNLFYSSTLLLNFALFSWKFAGGAIIESKLIFSAFSIITGIISNNKGEDNSRHGFVLISISQGWKSQSIMKSKPNISKLCVLRSGSRSLDAALIESIAIFFICG